MGIDLLMRNSGSPQVLAENRAKRMYGDSPDFLPTFCSIAGHFCIIYCFTLYSSSP